MTTISKPADVPAQRDRDKSEGTLLEVRDLHVEFHTRDGVVKAVNGVNYSVSAGETLAVLGESGSGKSVTAQAIMGILDMPPAKIPQGEILFRGQDMLKMSGEQRRKIRGAKIAMIFQDALSSLNPVLSVGYQLSEMFRVHQGLGKKAAKAKSIELMDRVKIPAASKRVDDYPHQFSGGMRQRIMIAMALALEPDLIIADEPTTALDVTVTLPCTSCTRLPPTRTPAVCSTPSRAWTRRARSCTRSRACRPTCSTFRRAARSTRAARRRRTSAVRRCRRCTPSPTPAAARATSGRRRSMAEPKNDARREPILEVRNLVKHFPLTQGILFKKQVGAVKAVDGISFELYQGETLGIVGESGCGKSTVAKLLMNLERATSGEVFYKGQDITKLSGRALKAVRRNIQMVFQDPYTSLNPRMTVGDIIGEPFDIHPEVAPKGDRRRKVQELLDVVGLNPEYVNRYPHQFSGGQRQRIGIARGLALNPEIIICDEPVSALDVSVQAQVINLMEKLQDEFNLSYLFIAHDLSIVRHISDRVGVMYLGKMAEIGTDEQIYDHPTHPYTQALLSAVPVPDPDAREGRERIILTGDVPSPANPPSGCRFRTRCWKAQDKCAEELPLLAIPERFAGSDSLAAHESACHFAEEKDVVGAA